MLILLRLDPAALGFLNIPPFALNCLFSPVFWLFLIWQKAQLKSFEPQKFRRASSSPQIAPQNAEILLKASCVTRSTAKYKDKRNTHPSLQNQNRAKRRTGLVRTWHVLRISPAPPARLPPPSTTQLLLSLAAGQRAVLLFSYVGVHSLRSSLLVHLPLSLPAAAS